MTDQTQFPEAGAVINVDYKRTDGFVVKLTLRDETGKKVLERLEGAIKQIVDEGGTPYEKTFNKKPAAPVEYVQGRTCPKCNQPLVKATTAKSKKMIKCSTNKWIDGKAVGCDFIEWINYQPVQPSVPTNNTSDYGEY